MKIKSFLLSANQFLKNYGLVLLVVLGGGYWLLGGNENNHHYRYNEVASVQSMPAMGRMAALMDYDSDDSFVSRSRVAKEVLSDALSPAEASAQGFDPEDLSDRKIIKNGSLQLEVEDTEEALGLVNGELKSQSAYVTHQNSWEVRRGTLAYNLTIRVPAENLETLSQNLEQLGLKKGENYSTRDITAQYRDTDNRIKNLEVRRERLRELMSRETENISDILQIERELTRVQDEIDQLGATQKQRDTDVTYSTLELTINPEPEIGDFSSPDWNLEYSWKTAVNDFLHDARTIVDKLIRIVVYTPIWLPILLIGWAIKRALFGRRKAKDSKPAKK